MLKSMNGFPIVAIIPSLNPDEKLPEVVKGLFAVGFSDVILVNDGSRQECVPIFQELSNLPGCVVLNHECNKGKGRALKTAFSYYLENYDPTCYYGVVTADADGQHLPQDIYKTAQSLMEDGKPKAHTMALGTRDFNEEHVPFKSRNGNKITTVVFKILYGKWINDTQTGLRAISNDFVKDCLEIRGERFEYEINMLIRGVLQKVEMVEVIIETVYFDNNRETHFHPVKDSIRIYRVMLASFLKFACSGLISMLVDQGIFALLQKLVFTWLSATISIPLSTVIARVCSSLLNYSLNRTVVFESGKKGANTIVRYYTLCVLQMIVSAGLVTGIHLLTQWDSSALKLIVDCLLFFVSYRIQRNWVFKEEPKKC